jgi:GT2 family glycosyltransferase
MTAPRVRVVVPRRVDCGERDRLWRYCRPQWERDDWQLVEAHHDDGGPFNRAAAINDGAAAPGTWDVLVVIDSDIVIDGAAIDQAVDVATATGQLVLPYQRRRLVGQTGTRRILAGQHAGPWDTVSRADSNTAHCSSVIVAHRTLWETVGGFDERFVGWGGEDDAFHAACLTLAGVERLPGDVFHLHHRPSPEKDWRAPLYLQCKALAERHVRLAEDGDSPGMVRLLGERHRCHAGTRRAAPWDTVAVVLTTGTRWQLGETLDSFERNVACDEVTRRLMCVDSPDDGIVDELAATWPAWDVVHTSRGVGYAGAVAAAREEALRSGQPWVWWMEDDFRFERPVPIYRLQAAMPQRCAQMSLMRQAWYDHETAAGGVIAANPDAFTDVNDTVAGLHVAHRAYWTQNPHLTRRATLTRPWPAGKDSERRYGADLFAEQPDVYCGVWGVRDDPPAVTHLGDQQAGHGY